MPQIIPLGSALYKSRHMQTQTKKQQEDCLKAIKEAVEKQQDFNPTKFESELKDFLQKTKEEHDKINVEIEKTAGNSYQAQTNKMFVIATRTLSFLERDSSALSKILEGKYPTSFNNNDNEFTQVKFNTKKPLECKKGDYSNADNVLDENNEYYGTVRVDIMNMLLLSTLHILNPDRYKEIDKSALSHETPVKLSSPMEDSLFFKLDNPGVGKYMLRYVNGGYAYGGSRNENPHWKDDSLLHPDDCSSLVGRYVGKTIYYTTSRLIDFFQPPNSVKVEYQVNYKPYLRPIKDLSEVDIDCVWVVTGHCGFVGEVDRTSSQIRLVHAAREIEKDNVDGIGISQFFNINKPREHKQEEPCFFKIQELGEHHDCGLPSEFSAELKDLTKLSDVTITNIKDCVKRYIP